MISVMDMLFSKQSNPFIDEFDSLWMPGIYNYITYEDESKLYSIAMSSMQMRKKYKEIDDIMKARGFKKFGAGTNRVVYRYLEDPSFVAKIAIDNIGIEDNPNEYRNQHLLKPFVAKMFHCSGTGVIAFSERVKPIVNVQEYKSVAGPIFDIISMNFIGKYVMDDIGSKFFMNWGFNIRTGLPVLLDYPYLFELDERKLYCNRFIPGSAIPCGGVLDYDEGFNFLRCTKCGKEYFASEIRDTSKKLVIVKKGEPTMGVKIVKEGKVLYESKANEETTYIAEPKNTEIPVKRSNVKIIGIKIDSEDEYEIVDENVLDDKTETEEVINPRDIASDETIKEIVETIVDSEEKEVISDIMLKVKNDVISNSFIPEEENEPEDNNEVEINIEEEVEKSKAIQPPEINVDTYIDSYLKAQEEYINNYKHNIDDEEDRYQHRQKQYSKKDYKKERRDKQIRRNIANEY